MRAIAQHAITEALSFRTRTLERDSVKARGWLYQDLSDDAF